MTAPLQAAWGLGELQCSEKVATAADNRQKPQCLTLAIDLVEALLAYSDRVKEHYATADITVRVLTAIRTVKGPDVPLTPDTLTPIDHFHGRGVIATEELASAVRPKASDHLLDIGCGIGGPARWIAAK
jgi:hypothetical protein